MKKQAVFSFEERLIHALRKMYGSYGYLPFKMSKFEEYDFYMKNREFLIGESIISFTDADGSLLALKPDVTLSIIKNARVGAGVKEKVYYSENVYRTSASSHRFKEIMQMGLECIGDVDEYDVFETIALAAKSLSLINENFVLDISNMGLLASVLDATELGADARSELLSFIAGKNLHEAKNLLEKFNTPPEVLRKISALVSLRTPILSAADAIRSLKLGTGADAAAEEVERLSVLLSSAGLSDKIFFDASVMNDMNYYNGIVFRGFIAGISEAVLSGGRYDALMGRMGRRAGALGFAIYLDLLENFEDCDGGYDVDVLLIYDEKLDTGAVISRVNELLAEGFSVCAQRAVPERLRYARLETLEA